MKFYLPEKQAFIKLPWIEENLKYAKCGYLLIKRLVHDKRGRRVLSSEEELIQFLGNKESNRSTMQTPDMDFK